MAATTAAYGTWKSPISSQIATESGVELVQLAVDMDPNYSDTVYWNEVHFDDNGRTIICSSNKKGEVTQWTPPPFNARSTVHEYGGGDFFVYCGTVYFSNFTDQALYKQTSPKNTPVAVTDTSKAYRYADGSPCQQKNRIFCIREDHEVVKQGCKEPQNTIVSIDPDNKTQTVLVKGCDFYINPRVSQDGKKIAWVQFNHPNMPWDSTEIWVAELSSCGDKLVEGTAKRVVGGKNAEGLQLSVMNPAWTADGQLMYIGDQTNWWNLYHINEVGEHINLCPRKAEIGGVQWMFGRTPYVLEPNGGSRIITSYGWELGILDMKTKTYKKIETGFSSHDRLAWTAAGSVYCVAFSETKFAQVIRVNINNGKVDVIRVSMAPPVDSKYFSIPQKISWPTTFEEICHGLYYPPTNKDYVAPQGELPPLLVRAHGGPTMSYLADLDLQVQYFTSRGFAVLCVNYRGTPGYGRAYRDRLKGMWGILDIDDCCSGVQHLVSKGKADLKRICIDGQSAGGYSTLACLTFTDTFTVGVSHYGIGDLEGLLKEIHKFESRYLNVLLAPPGKDIKEICQERSPIHHIDQLKTATGFFHGDIDNIVPFAQAKTMYEAVKAKGLPAMYVLLEGEGHGFRIAENIQSSLDGEFYFFGKVLGFEPADKGITLPIDNI